MNIEQWRAKLQRDLEAVRELYELALTLGCQLDHIETDSQAEHEDLDAIEQQAWDDFRRTEF